MLAAAAAGLNERLAPHRLSAASGPAERARIHRRLGQRLDQAHQAEKAAPAYAAAVRLYRELSASNPRDFDAVFAESSFELAMTLVFAELEPWAREPLANLAADTARLGEAAAAFRDAIEVFRRLAADDPGRHQEALAVALTVASFLVPRLGPSDLAVAAALEAVDMVRHLAQEEPEEWAHQLPYVLVASAVALAAAHPEQARALADEAVGIARRMAQDAPETNVEHLVFTLTTQGSVLLRLERAEEAIDALSEAAELSGRAPQAGQGEDAWSEVMAHALSFVWVQERATGVTTGRSMAVEVLSRLAHGDTSGRAPALLTALTGLVGMLEASAHSEDALTVRRAMIHLIRTSDEIPYAGGDGLIGRSDVPAVLIEAGVLLARTGRWEEALGYLDEAARELWADGTGPLESCFGSALTFMTATLAGLEPDENEDPYRRMARPQAVRVLERMAETYRRLAQDDPAAHGLSLAATVKILSEALWDLGRSREAVDAGRESVRNWRGCAARDGAADHRDQLALALRRLADKLTDTGEAEEAATAGQEAAALWRALSRENPAHHRRVAAALHLVALNLRRLRPAEALSAAEESAGLLARFPADDPAEHHSSLATVNALVAELRRELRE
jgi:tetratricopeptide (TPR) repeat protein